jgi:hypothetical protein
VAVVVVAGVQVLLPLAVLVVGDKEQALLRQEMFLA